MEPILLSIIVIAVAGVAILAAWAISKGRVKGSGEVFRASRLSKGNRVFPTQVCISPTSVVHRKPQWVGQVEHSIHMAHVASVSIETNLLFSDVYIETTGGTTPIHCRGHRKRDALAMKRLIEQYQTAYYQQRPGPERNSAQGSPPLVPRR
jgi:hypothetical protein